MGIVRLMAKGTARDLAESHPQLRGLRAKLHEQYGLHPERARRLVVALVEHVANDLGDSYLGEMAGRLKKIENIRGKIAGAIDHVVTEGKLPAELDKAALNGLFDDLQKEMGELRSVRKFAETHKPKLTRADERFAKGPFGSTGDKLQGHVPATPVAPLRQAMAAIERDNPARAAAFWKVFDKHGDAVADAVLAISETNQEAALARLQKALGKKFPKEEFDELSTTIKELSKERHKASIGPGSPTAAIRAQRAAGLPQELRGMVVNDNTILGPLAESNPKQLRELWKKWNDGGRTRSFRDYVHGEMTSEFRPTFAELEAAHGLAARHKLKFLKDPAAFDPDARNLRSMNPREPGTDLVGLRPDGEIWYVDDKSHRLTPTQKAAGRTRLGVSEVSAFEGPQLITNMRKDVTDMEAAIQRIVADGGTPDPKAVEAVGRIRKAADALDRETAGWSEADWDSAAGRAKVRRILARPGHRISLKVTSAMGDVTHVTEDLAELGVKVAPTFRPAKVKK
jgi:hypothetical protein